MRLAGPGQHWVWVILAFAFLLRLVGLDEPLTDQQAWRQTDTAAIARNFSEEGYHLLYPRVDWRGDTPGFVETNFPLFPFLASLGYGLVGESKEWIGRLLAAVFSTLSVGCLFLLARRSFGQPTASLAAVIYAVLPLSWFFGRAFMPEALMMALSLGTLLSMQRWLDRPGAGRYLAAIGTAGLCFMVKIPTLYLGFPLLAMVWHRRGWRLFRSPALWGYALAVLLPSLAWYLHAASLFDQTGLTFGIWGREGYDKWDPSLWADPGFYVAMADRFLRIVATPAGLPLAAAGLFLLWRQRRSTPAANYILWWCGALLLYLILVPEGNRKLHYYQLPFAPLLAILMALPLAEGMRMAWGTLRLRQAVVVGLVAAIAGFSVTVVRDYHRPMNNVYEYYTGLLAAGKILDQKLPSEARVVVGDLDENALAPHRAQNPSFLYYLHRKGWQITPSEFDLKRLQQLRDRGGTHFVTAMRFAMQSPLWPHLLRAGVSTPLSYPHTVHTRTEILQQMKSEDGDSRHFLVVRLHSL